jgi:hypothetical protein
MVTVQVHSSLPAASPVPLLVLVFSVAQVDAASFIRRYTATVWRSLKGRLESGLPVDSDLDSDKGEARTGCYLAAA